MSSPKFIPIDNAPANKRPPARATLRAQHYPTATWPELESMFGMSKRAIYNKAARMGLSRPRDVQRKPVQDFTIGAARVIVVPLSTPENPPIRNGTVDKGDHYAGQELHPYVGRPGAMDAFSLPSRAGSRRTYRDGAVEAV